ncbi:MAG: segregation/condensation protein A [Negativicutes bacterium]|nr:segregation/condensation protein A [Negativicutes bacterium]
MNAGNAYTVRLETFEGPLALLMHLIDKNQIDIYDIPVALVTEQYLTYIKTMEQFNIEIASEFLVMAATLLQIKSRMLLPKPPKDTPPEEEGIDPRQELVDRLIEYKKFKEAAALLGEMAEIRGQYFTRQRQELAREIPLPEGLTIDDLLMAFAAVWESHAAENAYGLVAREEITVQDKMHDILYLLRSKRSRLSFDETLLRSGSRSEMVAAFLAVLELIRLKRITITQEKSFGAIYLTLKE